MFYTENINLKKKKTILTVLFTLLTDFLLIDILKKNCCQHFSDKEICLVKEDTYIKSEK